MIRYTTPTISIQVEDVSLSEFDSIYVSIAQSGTTIEIVDPPIDGDTINVFLTQSQTAQFDRHFPCQVQINALKDGKRYASEMMTLNVDDNLLKRVIP